MKRKQKKAVLGAVVGGAIGLAGGLIGGLINKKSAEKAAAAQRRMANRQVALQSAQNLTSAYGNQEYVDDFNKKIVVDSYKYGGVIKRKQKKKFTAGGNTSGGNTGGFNWDPVISGAFNAIGSITNSAFNAKAMSYQNNTNQPIVATVGSPKENIEQPDYVANDTNNIDSRLLLNNNLRIAKYGTKRMRCKR